ncbi:hypothetical protein CAPN007_02310 [Capnocytophaga canimorsus]|nr:hypothetical protein CAPN007_02310 [Capnocytophaga canimorsus]
MSLVMKKISSKIQKKIDNIERLQSQIKDWKEKKEEEIQFLLKEFEKTPRDEGSECYTKYFTDNHFANILVEIGNTYPNNLKISLYVVSALGMMMWRYRLKETEEIYQLMIDNSQKKNVAPYVAIYLPKMEKFTDYPDKWSYFMSIRRMTPKKVAETKFIDLIEQNIEEMPSKFKAEVYDYFTEKYNLANNDYSRNRYLSMINKLKDTEII